MKPRLLTYSLLLSTLLMGCGERIGMHRLEQLESRVSDAPDSVLAVLTLADMPRWGEARALYALLTVQAQDKSYIDVADDSLIRVATDYYDHRGTPLRRLQAFYYHGRVYANAGHRHEAMAAYSRAKDFVPQVNAPYPVGLLYFQLGVLYGNDYDYLQGLAYMKEALKYYELGGLERLQYVTKRNMGQIYLSMENTKQAEPLFKEVLAWGEVREDTNIIYNTLSSLLRLYDATRDTVALESLLDKYSIETVLQNATVCAIIAHHHARKGEAADAEAALSRAWEVAATAQDTAMLWHKSYQAYSALDLPYEALHSHEKLLAHQDSVVRITLQQPLIASQLNHYQSRLQIEELRNLNYRYLLGISALTVLIVAAVLYVFYRERFRKKSEQVKHYMNAANQLRVALYDKEEELLRVTDTLHRHVTDADTMKQRVALLFKERYSLLDNLCTTYYENPQDNLRRKEIFERVSAIINSFSTDAEYTKLESIVNECRQGVIARLRQEFPKFKESDFRLLCYFCAGLSMQTICVITQKEADKLWVYKGRLIARIAKSDAPSKEIILSQIPQRIRKSAKS